MKGQGREWKEKNWGQKKKWNVPSQLVGFNHTKCQSQALRHIGLLLNPMGTNTIAFFFFSLFSFSDSLYRDFINNFLFHYRTSRKKKTKQGCEERIKNKQHCLSSKWNKEKILNEINEIKKNKFASIIKIIFIFMFQVNIALQYMTKFVAVIWVSKLWPSLFT